MTFSIRTRRVHGKAAQNNWSGGYVPMIANAAMRRGSFSHSTQPAVSILHGCTRNILTASNQIIPARATGGQSIHQNFENREPLHDFTSGAVCEGVKGYFAVRSNFGERFLFKAENRRPETVELLLRHSPSCWFSWEDYLRRLSRPEVVFPSHGATAARRLACSAEPPESDAQSSGLFAQQAVPTHHQTKQAQRQ